MLQIMVFWEDLTYHTVSWDPERPTVCRQIPIYSVCLLSYVINLTGLTHTETHQKKRKKKEGLSWKKMGTNVHSMNEQNIIVPKTSTVSHQTSRVSCRRQFLQPKNYKVRCKWWVSGEVRDISVRNSHFVDTAMFTRHVIEKREWQTCILCFCLWFCFLWYWQPFID